jgi:hypothetical protein
MRIGLVSAAASAAATLVIVSACSSSGTSSPATGPTDGSQSDAGRDAIADATGHPTSGDATADVVESGPATIRIANLSPDSGSLDFCIRAQSSLTFTTPPQFSTLGGDPGGLTYGQVTKYFEVTPGATVFRIVAGGAKDCSNGLTSDLLTEFQPRSQTTVAIEGELSVVGNDPLMAPYSYPDDTTSPASGIALRFIHAASGLTVVDFGLGTLAGSNYKPIFTGVTFGTAGGQGEAQPGTTVDSNGYLQQDAMSGQIMSAHINGSKTTDDAKSSPVTIENGSYTTMFLVGGKPGDTAHPVEFLQCDDGAAPTGALAKCAFDAP